MRARLELEARREHRDAQVVAHAFGWRVRLYLGRTFVDRPLVNAWRMGEHRGVCVRFSRGVRERPVVGLQWRRDA